MRKIDYILDPLIQFIKDQNAPRMHLRELVGSYQFAKEFETLQINPGRHCGKTWYIARTAKPNDIIFTNNPTQTKELYTRISGFHYRQGNVFSARNVPNHYGRGHKENIDTVWIDNASIISKDDIENIYMAFAGKCNQFVLIG